MTADGQEGAAGQGGPAEGGADEAGGQEPPPRRGAVQGSALPQARAGGQTSDLTLTRTSHPRL